MDKLIYFKNCQRIRRRQSNLKGIEVCKGIALQICLEVDYLVELLRTVFVRIRIAGSARENQGAAGLPFHLAA